MSGAAFEEVIEILIFSVSVGSILRMRLYPIVVAFNTSSQALFSQTLTSKLLTRRPSFIYSCREINFTVFLEPRSITRFPVVTSSLVVQ